MTGLWFLALGDPAAGYIGKRFGRHVVAGTGGKTLEGFAANFAVCFLVAFLFLFNPQVGPQLPLETTSGAQVLMMCFVGALTAAITELSLPAGGVLDNLFIAFGGSLSMAMWFNGWETLGSYTVGLSS